MSKSNVKRARKSMRKITIEGSGKNLTTYGGLIAGARSLDESIRVWGDSVLRKLGGRRCVMDATIR